MKQQADVAIIGGGPVGLSLAALLAARGHASVVLEADDNYCTGSRAICLSRRTLEVLDWAAITPAILEKALPWTRGRSYYGDKEVLAFEMPHSASQRFFPMVNIQQYYVEQFAHEAAQRYDTKVDLRWGSRLTALQQDSDEVRIQYQQGEQQKFLHAKWVIACDGARSTCRELLGLSLKGTSYEGKYVIVDIKQKSVRPTERLAWFDPPTNPGSTLLMHRQPDDIWRIDYQLRDDEDPIEAIKPENVLPRVKAHLEWIGETEPWEALWISMYNARCLTLDEYRHGRVFFAGDAAHLVPIFGVRGLNSGIDDIGNLSWKLAEVLDGKASQDLLNSYSIERRAAALTNIEFGSRSTEFMAPPSHGFTLMRQAVLRLAESTPKVRALINPRQSAPVRYAGSGLIGPNLGFITNDLMPGTVVPEVSLNNQQTTHGEQYLSQLLGTTWLLGHFGAPDTRNSPYWSSVNLSHVAELFEATERTLYLIRPDGYIAARWQDAQVSQAVAFFESLYHGA